MWSLSHLIKGRLATHAGQRNRTAHSIAGEQWPETAPYPETECFRNMLPLIFKTEKQRSEPLPLFSSPLSSQSSCFSLLPNAHKSMPDGNLQRPLRRCSEEQSHSDLQAWWVPESSAAGDSLPLLPLLARQPPTPQLWSRFEAIQSSAVHQMCLLLPWQPAHLEHIFRLLQCH